MLYINACTIPHTRYMQLGSYTTEKVGTAHHKHFPTNNRLIPYAGSELSDLHIAFLPTVSDIVIIYPTYTHCSCRYVHFLAKRSKVGGYFHNHAVLFVYNHTFGSGASIEECSSVGRFVPITGVELSCLSKVLSFSCCVS